MFTTEVTLPLSDVVVACRIKIHRNNSFYCLSSGLDVRDGVCGSLGTSINHAGNTAVLIKPEEV